MLAISPHTKSFCSTNSSGPGCSPQINSPPSSTAAVGDPGMPSEHRQQCRRAGRVCGGLRRYDTFELTRAELGAIARRPQRLRSS